MLARRERLGLRQAEVARRCGLQASAISHFERERRVPDAYNLCRLAEALKCSTDWLLGGD